MRGGSDTDTLLSQKSQELTSSPALLSPQISFGVDGEKRKRWRGGETF